MAKGKFSNHSVKPLFQELGPYTFDETKEKVNVTWNKNNTVSFYHLKRWWFNPNRSKGNLNDSVTSVNPIALSSAVTAKDWNIIIKQGLNVVLNSVSPSVHSTHLAGEVLFEGYDDPLLTMANNMPAFGVPSLPNFDKFGWFYMRNNSETYEGHFNMDTGITGQLGQLYSWKHMQYTPYYPDECGKITGSAGEFFPSNLKKDTLITFFSPDLCRYAQLQFEEELVVNGVLGYKYVAGDRFLDNGTSVSENKCFCKGDCMPSGALDISACRYGSPAFVSLPHFHKADSYYRSKIDGIRPNKDRHDFFMVFEPKTGMPLQVSARLQLNLLLKPLPGIRYSLDMGSQDTISRISPELKQCSKVPVALVFKKQALEYFVGHKMMFEKVPNVYIPVLWFEQSVVMPDNFIFFLTILTNFEVICLGTGIISIFLSVIFEVCYCYRLCNTNLLRRKENRITREEVPLTHKQNGMC